MSIDREMFETMTEDELAGLSVPYQVLDFLAAHDDRAFRTHEIASRTALDEDAVSAALSRLKNRDLVGHKATYWLVTGDSERLEVSCDYEYATALFNDTLGREDK